MKSASFLVALSVCMLACQEWHPALGQTREFGTKGVVELGGSVSFSSISNVTNGKTGDATTVLSIAPRIAGFITDGFQIGLSPGVSFLSTSGFTVISPSQGESTTMLQIFVFPGYVVRTQGQNVFPFLETPLGYSRVSSGSSSQSGFSWGVRGGVKVTPAGNFLLTVFGEYYQITMNREGAKERSGYNQFTFGVGFGAYI